MTLQSFFCSCVLQAMTATGSSITSAQTRMCTFNAIVWALCKLRVLIAFGILCPSMCSFVEEVESVGFKV